MLQGIFKYIDDHSSKFVEELVRLCRQPSVSAQNLGLQEMASLLQNLLESIGFKAQLFPLKEGPPVVYGELKSKSESVRKTLIFYNHYDVQPPEPLELWKHPPFSAVIEDGKIYARGASDNKANIVSRIAAVEAFLHTSKDVPCNVKFVLEGEEEIGSPHLSQFIQEQKSLLVGDAAIWEFGGLDYGDVPAITLGLKGMLYVELWVKGPAKDTHSARAAIVENPAWRLVKALNTIRDKKGRILIPGWYDDVRAFSKEELEAIRKAPSYEEQIKEELQVSHFLRDLSGTNLKKALAGSPTANIAGLYSGYIGEGHKTVLPSYAMAKMDFRLVPDQDPEDLAQKLIKHLRDKGFADIELKIQSKSPAARTPLDAEIVRISKDTAQEIFNKEPIIHVSSAGSGPMHLFTNILKLPTVAVGCNHAYSNAHAPNENQRIDAFIQGTKWIAAIMARFGQSIEGR